MAYIIKARFYAGLDQLGESYVITSDNNLPDTKLEVGSSVEIEVQVQPINSVDNEEGICRCGLKKPYEWIRENCPFDGYTVNFHVSPFIKRSNANEVQ